MVEFKRELQQSNGQHFVYVRPLGDVTDDDWVDYFTTQFDTTPVAEFFMLVDLVGIEDSIGLEGFTRLSDLIKAQGFRRTPHCRAAAQRTLSGFGKNFQLCRRIARLGFQDRIVSGPCHRRGMAGGSISAAAGKVLRENR